MNTVSMALPGRLARRVAFGAALAGLLGSAAACSSSSGSPAAQTSAGATQTIVFATDGLGGEGQATDAAIAGFEKAYPNIKVQVFNLDASATNQLTQLDQRFQAGTGLDVIDGDVTWAPQFAAAGYIQSLAGDGFTASDYFPGQVASAQYNGSLYGVPWFINAEGVYYRTDLVKSAPTSPAQLVSDAQAALKADPSLKEGFAWEGDKYEGSVCALVDFLGGFGGKLDLSDLNTPANQAALAFMYATIHTDKITPQAASSWEESNVQSAWESGQTAFALNWPYEYASSEKLASLKNDIGWIPFPTTTGTPAAALGGDNLMIAAKSGHTAADLEFVKYLTSASVETARAESAGDPPSVQAAYTPALYASAPYFKAEQAVFADTVARPSSPVYQQISEVLQTMISSVLAGQESPSAALSSAQSQIQQIPGYTATS
jgi:multiple sugar transport system substrate-binding protein